MARMEEYKEKVSVNAGYADISKSVWRPHRPGSTMIVRSSIGDLGVDPGPL